MKTFTVALLATVVAAWGEPPVLHSHYKDIKVQRPFTQDASGSKTITDVKQRQNRRLYPWTTTSTVYDDQVENRQRNVLVTNPSIKNQQVNSTSYSTAPTMGSQDRTRFDVVQQSRDTKIDSFQTNDKLVNIIDSEVAYDTVTSTRDNILTINKLCDSSRVIDVTETILQNQTELIDVIKTRPVQMTTLEDQVVLTTEEEEILVDQIVSTETEVLSETTVDTVTDVEEIILVDVDTVTDVDEVILVDVETTTDVEETILVDVIKSRSVAGTKLVQEKSYKLENLLIHDPTDSSSDECEPWMAWCNNKSNGHKVITKKIPQITTKEVPTTRIENYTVQVPQTNIKKVKSIKQVEKVITKQVASTRQEQQSIIKQVASTKQVPVTRIVASEKTIQVPQIISKQVEKIIQVPVTTTSLQEYTAQEERTIQVPVEITRQETINEKVPCTETINHPTTTTQQRPRTVLINKQKAVDVQSIRSDPVTQVLNVSQPRTEQAPTMSMEAIRNDSSRNNAQSFNSQELAVEDWSVVRKIARDVSNTRQRATYDDVTVERSYETPVQAVSDHLQTVTRQSRLSHAHSDLGTDHPNVVAVRDATIVDIKNPGSSAQLAPLGSSKNYLGLPSKLQKGGAYKKGYKH